MSRTKLQIEADQRAQRTRRDLADGLSRLARDAGLTERDIARSAGLGQSSVCRILNGTQLPSVETYHRLGAVLGADFSGRYFPNTGPAIRDRLSAPMLEALLAILDPRWRPYPEVPVRKPSRGWIDAALHDARAGVILATELQSELRRLEQLVRWHAEKAASLPSWSGWPSLGHAPEISQLLIVRRTRATRAVANEFARQLRIAYPAHPDDAIEALTTPDAAWPGPALVWAEVGGARARLLGGR